MIGGITAMALTASGATISAGERVDRPSAHLLTPAKSLDIIASGSPAASAIAVSRRFFASSPVVALADATDPSAQQLAIRSATALAVPVLLDDPSAAAEIARLHPTTVLTFGHTAPVPGSRPVTASSATKEVEHAQETLSLQPRRHRDILMLSTSRHTDAVALANASNAGAAVVELPSADARTDPYTSALLADNPTTPIVALGSPFERALGYSVAVVRARAAQPSGGYFALPGHTYTAMYGHPQTSGLGVLGEQGVKASVVRAKRLAHKYAQVDKTGASIVPTFEIIASVASSGAGKDKNYSNEASLATLRPLVYAAGKAGIYVILDLQPGRTDFLTQAKRYRALLELPHVGLALDPEWRLTKHQKPLQQIGSVRVEEINKVSDWLAALTRQRALPQKVFVLHEFSSSMIKHRSRLNSRHPELATVIHVDGQGSQPAKQGTWKALHHGAPKGVFWGWKNFVSEDKPMLSVPKTWHNVKPRPDLITYQ